MSDSHTHPDPVPSDPVDIVTNRSKLLSSTMAMASGTLVSRVLGGVKILLVGYLLTVSMAQADMYSLAMEIPNMAYQLLAGGILTAILVPQFMRAMNKDADGGQAFSDRIVTLFTLLLIVLTVLLTIGTPLVIRLMSDAKWRTPGMAPQYHSLLLLTALCMPQVFFFGAFFLVSQILNARGSFGPGAWAPVANNVVQIIVLGTYAIVWGFHTDASQPFSTPQMLLLGIGSVIGVAVQSAILFPYLKKVGFRYRPRFDFLHTGLGSTAQMAKWVLALLVIDQINWVVVTRLASRATVSGHGAGVAAFNNATWISIVPHGLLTVSLATVLMPSLSTLSATGQWERFASQLQSSIRTVFAAIIPIALLFGTMGVPIATTVFSAERGGAYVGWTLAILGVGLIPFTLRYLVNKGFNSMSNTRTPFFVEIVFVSVTCLVSIALILGVKVSAQWVAPSLALGYSIAYVVSSWLAYRLLQRAVPTLKSASLAAHTIRLIAISVPGAAIAGAICWAQERIIPGLIPSLTGLVIAGLAGIGVYWGLAKLIRVTEVQDLETLIRSKLRKETTVVPTPEGAQDAEATQDILEDAGVVHGDDTDIDSETAAIAYVFGSDETQPILTGLTPLEPGVLIGDRYRLGKLVTRIGSASRWSGVDEGLSRPVFITAFANDDRTMTILEAARIASGAMDARFLRILDAGQDADGAYIVSEWAEGRTLSEILASGPLSGEESAWVVREVAAGLASIHAMQVYHCRLDPTKILITTAGSVKISGLRVDQALTPRETDNHLSRQEMEAMDVVGCGGLLYACLTATWPGSANVGLEPSPVTAEGLKSPLHVRPGTSVTLDRLTHHMLSVNSPEHITTAQGIVQALSSVLGTTDPTASLAKKASAEIVPVVRPVAGEAVRPHIVQAGEDRTVAMTLGGPESSGTPGSFGSSAGTPGSAGSAGLPGTAAISGSSGSSGLPGSAGMPGSAGVPQPGSVGPAVQLRHPLPPEKAATWSRVFLILVILVVLALVTALIVGLYNSSRDKGESEQPGGTGPAAAGQVHPIAGGTSFDLFGDGENDNQVHLAYDRDPSTAWITEVYPNATYIPERKSGVGIVLDLGSPQPVDNVSLTVDLLPVSVTIYVPRVATPDMSTLNDWTSAATANLTGTETDIAISPTTTQYVLVYMTSLVEVEEDGYGADIAEVSISG